MLQTVQNTLMGFAQNVHLGLLERQMEFVNQLTHYVQLGIQMALA